MIESLLDKCDSVLIGGGMIFTFYKALGYKVGASLIEEDMVGLAKELMDKAAAKGVKLLLPSDVTVADKFAADAESKVCEGKRPSPEACARTNGGRFCSPPPSLLCSHVRAVDSIPDGWMGLDIGPKSIAEFGDVIGNSDTIVWNGPMGVFEFEKFAIGTNTVAQQLADATARGATTIIGGGDSVAAVNQAGLGPQMSHISTGGGASLELLEGKVLPGVAALSEARGEC